MTQITRSSTSTVAAGGPSISARAIGRARSVGCAVVSSRRRCLRSRQSARPACRLAADASPERSAPYSTRGGYVPTRRPPQAPVHGKIACRDSRGYEELMPRSHAAATPARRGAGRKPRHRGPARPPAARKGSAVATAQEIADLAWAGQHAKAIELATRGVGREQPRHRRPPRPPRPARRELRRAG